MAKKDSFTSNSESETIAFGRKLAGNLGAGDVVALKGNLGTGKTHLVKGIAQAFGVDTSRVHSPTFSLIHEYGREPAIYHFDCYRMESVREALEIGIEEYLYGSGVCIIEWPELVKSILPDDHIWIELETTARNERQIHIKKS